MVCTHARAALGEERDARSDDAARQGAVREARARSVADHKEIDGGGGMKKLITVALALVCGAAHAQTYPNRAVRVIVAAQTGGPDIVAPGGAAEPPGQKGHAFGGGNQGGANGTRGAPTPAQRAPPRH